MSNIYNVYLSGVEYSISANENDSLSSIREKLEKLKEKEEVDNFKFVYYNTMTETKTILEDSSIEGKRKIKQIVFDKNTLLMTIVKGEKTDLFGTKTEWFTDRNMGAQINLNIQDGKFKPIMLTDISPSNPNSDVFFNNAVICEKGSTIEFRISSWGAAGFGFSIESEKESIVDRLYLTFGTDQNTTSYTTVSRYQESANTIQVDSTESLNIGEDDAVHYQKITIKTWRLTSYKKDGTTYSSDMKPPRRKLKAAFSEESTNGDTYVPGKYIENAAPSRGGHSDETFGPGISELKEDDPKNTVIGSIVLYFFVFKDRESAEKTINVLNAYNPRAIG